MRRVWGLDVLECPRCNGRARVIALIDDPAIVAAILRHLGLPTTPPPLHPAQAPPEEVDAGA